MIEVNDKIRLSCGYIDYPLFGSTLLDDTNHKIVQWADMIGKSNIHYLIHEDYPPSHHLE